VRAVIAPPGSIIGHLVLSFVFVQSLPFPELILLLSALSVSRTRNPPLSTSATRKSGGTPTGGAGPTRKSGGTSTGGAGATRKSGGTPTGGAGATRKSGGTPTGGTGATRKSGSTHTGGTGSGSGSGSGGSSGGRVAPAGTTTAPGGPTGDAARNRGSLVAVILLGSLVGLLGSR